MTRFYLKNTNEEIKVGNKIQLDVPIKTPYGDGNCKIEVVVTEDILKKLIKDGLAVEKINVEGADFDIDTSFELYKPFIRRIARKLHCNLTQAIQFLALVRAASPKAHSIMMLETMAQVMNKDKERSEHSFVVIPNSDKGHLETEEQAFEDMVEFFPTFLVEEDADRAMELIHPFCKKDEQKD